MQKVNATDFKARCLALLDEVRESGKPLLPVLEKVAQGGKPLLILKRGKPVAQLVPPPAAEEGARYPQETLRGSVRILGDIVSPACSAEDWDAVRGVLLSAGGPDEASS